LQSPSERVTIRPDFCPDLVPKKRGRSRLLVRISTGLYRYGPTGCLFWCRKINGKNVWRNLQTTDKARAMAITALNIYAAGQNGHTEMTVSPATTPLPDSFTPPDFLTTEPTVTLSPSPPAAVSQAPAIITTASAAKDRQTPRSLTALVERFRNESNHLATATREKFDCHFKVAAKHLNFDRDVSSITLADLRQLKSELSNGRKPSSVNDIVFKAIGALFRMALEDEIIQKSPLEKLKRARKGEPDRAQPNWEQAQQIEIEVARYATETAIIVGFMRNFGVGQAEIRHLLGENVDSEKSAIHFRRKKTGKAFDVPIFPHARDFIEKLKKAGRLRAGNPVVEWRNPRKALATACERLSFPYYEPRALRRSFIVHCLQEGIDPRLVAKWQGHKDAKLIFSVYGKFIDQSYERTQAERLGGSNGQPPPDGASVSNEP
jgi:integrase